MIQQFLKRAASAAFVFVSVSLSSQEDALAKKNDLSLFHESTLFIVSGPVPIEGLATQFQGSYRAKKHAFAIADTVTGVRVKGIKVGQVISEGYFFKINKAGSRFLHNIQNRLPLTANESIAFNASLKRYAAEGIHVAFQIIETPKLNLEISYNWLNGYDIFEGDVRGSISTLSNNDYDFNSMTVNSVFAKDRLTKQSLARPTGAGGAAGLNFKWAPHNRFIIDWKFRNLGGYLRWRNLPGSLLIANTDNKRFTEDGYVVLDPALTGRISRKSYYQSIPWYGQFTHHLQVLPALRLDVDYFANAKLQYVGFGAAATLNHSTIGFLYRPSLNATSIQLTTQYVSMSISTDDNTFASIRHVAFSLNVSVPILQFSACIKKGRYCYRPFTFNVCRPWQCFYQWPSRLRSTLTRFETIALAASVLDNSLAFEPGFQTRSGQSGQSEFNSIA